MASRRPIHFDSFRLDVKNEILWQGAEIVSLRPKAFMLLRYLVERPGQLVTKKEILDALWPDCHVGDCVLKQCIAEIRKILGDEADMPRFVETAHRRGYRFVGKIGNGGTGNSEQWPNGARERKQKLDFKDSQLVGRDSELAFLQHRLEIAFAGLRQVVFITGE
jgi:DNA-binding winged helix-turn-helix (wHTH) protein